MKRRIHCNQWGNWNGYEGARKVLEFGTDGMRAGHWMATGADSPAGAYENDATKSAAAGAMSAAIVSKWRAA